MIDECKHSYKYSVGEILSSKPLYDKDYKCNNCGKKIAITNDKTLLRGLTNLPTLIVTFILFYPFVNKINDTKLVIKLCCLLLLILGFDRLMIIFANFIIWLFHKKIKYVKVENKQV